jgi:hypothetical protein
MLSCFLACLIDCLFRSFFCSVDSILDACMHTLFNVFLRHSLIAYLNYILPHWKPVHFPAFLLAFSILCLFSY